jgi:murein L,D-transpeptidase YcbB/YkuD
MITCISHLSLVAQISPENLREFIENHTTTGQKELTEFYSRLHFQTAWIQIENRDNLEALQRSIEESPEKGLRQSDYNLAFITTVKTRSKILAGIADSLQAEVAITTTALHLYSDIIYGNIKPAFGYYGLDYLPACGEIALTLAEGIAIGQPEKLFERHSSTLPVIIALEKEIKWLHKVMGDSGYREVKISSGKVTHNNLPLITKLYQLGIIETTDYKIPDSLLKQKVKEAQRRYTLAADAVLRSNIIHELNIPLAARLAELNLAVNYYRWLNCLVQDQSTIVVNIPAAYMKVYSHGKVYLEMRMIVGKTATPTSTLASRVNEVILYPYWHVPFNIATKELLPAIKRNPGYLDAGNYQVLNKAGNIVDPSSVNWYALSTNYFPYLIRQSTGCDNALGLLKLNFYSPFGIYLHDTPGKSLFKLDKRFFSHGCMRMEKPMELGHLVLKNNGIAIDTLEQKGCLRNQAPVTIRADERMPVVVWYNPVDIDSTGRVIFYGDVYRKFAWLSKK